MPSPPGTPTPDPARILGVIELVVVVIAALALVAVTQAFLKVSFLHALAPTGKEPPFLLAQLLTLALFVMIGITALRRFRATEPLLRDMSGAA